MQTHGLVLAAVAAAGALPAAAQTAGSNEVTFARDYVYADHSAPVLPAGTVEQGLDPSSWVTGRSGPISPVPPGRNGAGVPAGAAAKPGRGAGPDGCGRPGVGIAVIRPLAASATWRRRAGS